MATPQLRLIPDAPALAAPVVPTRRFAPVLQFLTPVRPDVEEQLGRIAAEGHEAAWSLEETCYALHVRSQALGYAVTIGMQEVVSLAMPSFPGQQVVTPLLLLDLRPLH